MAYCIAREVSRESVRAYREEGFRDLRGNRWLRSRQSCSSLCYAAITIGLSISLQPSFSDTVVFIVYHIREKMYALFSFYKQV